MTGVFSDILTFQFPGSGKYFASTCTALALPALTGLSALVYLL